MVLELKVPHDPSASALLKLLPVFLSYVLSFVYVGIYWNNHHHLLHTVTRVSGRMLWANLHLLFWLSLLPFATAWTGENHFAALPTAVYGGVLLMSGVAYYVLQLAIVATHGKQSLLAQALGRDFKGKGSLLVYAVAIALALFNPWLANGLFVAVALWWLVPDARIVRALASHEK